MLSVVRSVMVLSGLAIALGVVACSKPDTEKKQPGQAFLDSQIPPGLSPQYFPPQGFVWAGYRTGSLPEARYGVASPPVNPRAQVLILADADYPAEAYFELANQLVAAGYGVWLFEAPGQGGAGRYLAQNQKVYARSYRDGQLAVLGLIHDIIHPTAQKPLFIVGTGYSALNVLSLSTMAKDRALAGYVAYAPYSGGQIDVGREWHREDTATTYWGAISHTWQISNPDLRLRVKSDTWQQQTRKAYVDLNSLHLPVISLTAKAAPVLIIEPGETSAPTAGDLCARLTRCKVAKAGTPEALSGYVIDFIRAELPASG